MQLHYSRRLFKQTLFQQSRRPHLQVQEAICYTPETCVMCQLWRAACGKGRPHPQCGLPTFLLIYHKWNFQWLAGMSPIYQITSKWHLLAHYSSLEAWPLKALTVSIQGSKWHVMVMDAGALATRNICPWSDMASSSCILVQSWKTKKKKPVEIQWSQTSGQWAGLSFETDLSNRSKVVQRHRREPGRKKLLGVIEKDPKAPTAANWNSTCCMGYPGAVIRENLFERLCLEMFYFPL